MQTLLLNASYEPLCVISVRRAVVLVLADKADVVAEADGRFRSARTSVPAPSVIRLRGYVRVPYRATLPLNRRNLVARDRGRCAYCGGRGDTIDHVIPRSRGGRHEWTNVVAACQPCNGRKGDKLLAELGWTLPSTPVAPKGWSWLVLGVATVDPAWTTWLDPA
jgi:5-methylcytosine-specific restriction endonuclease McrA